MLISLFTEGINNTLPSKSITIKEAHHFITSDKAQENTNTLRVLLGSDAKEYKSKHFQFVTFSGTFSKRKADNLKEFSGLICIDIDDVKNLSQTRYNLIHDKELPPILVFTSPSGNGIKAVYKVAIDLPPEHVGLSYDFIAKQLKKKHNIVTDQAPKSIATACFLPWDPEAFFNEDAELVPLPEFELSKKGTSTFSSTPAADLLPKVTKLVQYLEEKKMNIAHQYEVWRDICFALTDLGEAGRSLFHRISKLSPKYNSSDCDRMYDQCLIDRNGEISIGTFFYLTKEAGVPSGEVLTEFNFLTIIRDQPGQFWTDQNKNFHQERAENLLKNEEHSLVKQIIKHYGIPHETLCEYHVGLGSYEFKSGSVEEAIFIPHEHGIRVYAFEGKILKHEDLEHSIVTDSFFGTKQTVNTENAFIAENPFDAMFLSNLQQADVISPLMGNGGKIGKWQAERLEKYAQNWRKIRVVKDAEPGDAERRNRESIRKYADLLGTDTEVYWINPVKYDMEPGLPLKDVFVHSIENGNIAEKEEYIWNSWTQKCQFWYTTDGKKPKMEIDEIKLSKVLGKFGFLKLYFEDAEEPSLVKNTQNILNEVSSHRMNDFVRDEIIECLSKYVDVSPPENGSKLMGRNMLIRTYNKFRDKILNSNIKAIFPNSQISMLKEDEDTSYLFYSNQAVKVTKDTIAIIPYESLPGKIWRSQLLNRDYQEPHDSQKGDFEQFVENVSGGSDRGKKSFMSALGYLLHTYKDRANARAVILVDENSTPGVAQGGTGKSLFSSSIKHIRKQRYIAGKNVKTNSQFLFMDAKLGDQNLLFDDVKADFDFESLFNVITDDMQVEAKYKNRFTIPFEESPKTLITTNNVIHGLGNSFTRRQFILPFNDYYLKNAEPKKEFGRKFFTGWDTQEWGRFDDFMIRCLQEYLANGLTFMPTTSYEARALMESTSPSFYEWGKANLEPNLEYKSNVLFDGKDKTQHPTLPSSEYPKNRQGEEFPTFLETTEELTGHEFRKFNDWLKQFADFNGWKVHNRKSNGYAIIRFTT